jgi:excisionase family DNA binding protein
MTITITEPVQPDPETVSAADAALERVKGYLADHPDGPSVVRLRVDESEATLEVPRASVELFAQILAHLAAGHGVSVVPGSAELTTQQAADLLRVSRPYLIGLLDAGHIEYRKVGKHRRVLADSLLHYLRQDDQRRRAAADELTQLTQDLGFDG